MFMLWSWLASDMHTHTVVVSVVQFCVVHKYRGYVVTDCTCSCCMSSMMMSLFVVTKQIPSLT